MVFAEFIKSESGVVPLPGSLRSESWGAGLACPSTLRCRGGTMAIRFELESEGGWRAWGCREEGCMDGGCNEGGWELSDWVLEF